MVKGRHHHPPLHMHNTVSCSSSDLSSILQPESGSQSTTPAKTFYSLKDKLLRLLFSAISCETDSNNVQLLLHALMVFVSDIGQWWIQADDINFIEYLEDSIRTGQVLSTSINVKLNVRCHSALVVCFGKTSTKNMIVLGTTL